MKRSSALFECPVIDTRIGATASGFRAVSLFVAAGDDLRGSLDADLLAEACDVVRAGGPAWAEAHLARWSDAYAAFGAKPKRTPCSAQALRTRVLREGRIPAINPVVDLYNAVSLRYALPVGGENFDAYVGRPHLTIADGSEPFDTIANGEAVVEHPAPGEVIWRDDLGVTCRRWNWRQGIRTRLDGPQGRMWFVLEALETMPEHAVEEAGDVLADGLLRLMPGCDISRQRVSPS